MQFLDALGWKKQTQAKAIQKAIFVESNQVEKSIIKELQDRSKLHLDELALQTKQKISNTAAILLQLEMKGVVRALPAKYYELI